jgi:hypothetical protein
MKCGTELPRVLLLSSRRIRRTLFNSALYEFEDCVCGFDRAQLFCPETYHGDLRFDVARAARRAVALTGGRGRVLCSLVRHAVEFRPRHDYDLLFAVFDNPWDLELVNAVEQFRTRCSRVACYVVEAWSKTFESRRFRLENFADYDHIFLGTRCGVRPMEEVGGVPCTYFPPAVDSVRFSPWGRRMPRVIDIANLGRRTQRTHQALLALARDRGSFYLYDDIQNGEFDDPVEHRGWLANVLLRSRYSIANFARSDQPELTRGAREIGFRFMEGAGAGAVLLGAPPERAWLDEHLPWTDAVIPIPLDAPDVVDTIAELDRNPDRVEAARHRNIAGSLRRHDWVYRWELVLQTLDMAPTEAMTARRGRLQAEAARWDP